MKTVETCEKTPTCQEDIVPPQNLAHDDKDAPEKQDISNYVDMDVLDLKTGGGKTEGNQMSVHKNNTSASSAVDFHPKNGELAKQPDTETMVKGDAKVRKCVEEGDKMGSYEPASSSVLPGLNENSENYLESQGVIDGEATVQPTPDVKKEDPRNTISKDLENTDRKSESDDYEDDDVVVVVVDDDDDVGLLISDDCVPCVMEDESHYITTHEIQLSELSDHEVDFDIGEGSSGWEIEDDNQVYSFVDYASFDGDETVGERGARVKSNQARSNSGAAVSTLVESDLCDMAKCTSSDESLSKNQKCSGNSTGQIHLSIKTTSRAINDPSNIQERENILYNAKHSGDMSRYVFTGADGKAEKICDSAKCFIAKPGRLHFGTKLKAKDVNYSSGTSSAVSELDDADKEVRNLTARSFKSLAYPYFDAINFSTSSESSASEQGLGINRWSTYVGLKYGNVKVSQGLDPSVMSRKNSTSSFEIAKNIENKGYKGIALASIKQPPSKIFTLNDNPHRASSSTKKIELMGEFGQGHSGVITLTETLNFRCNVKSGMCGSERRPQSAQRAVGSRSTDGVTNTLPSGQRRGASKPPCNAGETMEDTHKKAIFASSIIKNVLSKKMQFEQERKMERGEICEPHQTPSPCLLQQETEIQREKATSRESRELRRQSSILSEAGSDLTIVCMDELGDLVDNSSCDTKSDSRRQDTLTLAPETNLESTNEAGIDTKKGAFEAAKSTLLRSQNSAFRSWRDGELEFQKEHKNDKTPEGKPPSCNDNLGETDLFSESENSKLTKMSHLFVPSIQLLSSDIEVEKQLPTMNYSTRAPADQGQGGGMELRSGNTLYVADSSRVVTSKSPEIKINLRSVRDNKSDPFGISKLRAPNIGSKATNLIRDDFRCQALAAALKGECSDKVPHFMVRDFRDNKGKLQTPIYQVRDVRKLVKSSYHFVSLDNNDNRNCVATADHNAEQKKQGPYRNSASVSPIVIKCQSVNTNNNGKQAGNVMDISKHRLNDDPFEIDRSSPEGAKSGSSLLPKAPGRVTLANTKRADSFEGPTGLKIETTAAYSRQEKTPDTTDKKPESKMANQVALEKLQAAVKTMEQLYVFDRNEWKRKSLLQPLTDSHVLSLITSGDHGGTEEEGGSVSSALPTSGIDKLVRRDSYPNTDKTPPALTASPGTDMILRREERETPKAYHSPAGRSPSRNERFSAKSLSMQGSGITGNKNTFSLSSSQKASAHAVSANNNTKATQPNAVTQTPYSTKGFVPKAPKCPVSLKISQTKHQVESKERPSGGEAERPAQSMFSAVADSENYLTIPVRSHAKRTKQATSTGAGHEKTSVYTFTATGAQTQAASPQGHVGHGTGFSFRGQEESRQSPRRSSIVMETRSQDTPTATIYHQSLPLGVSPGQPQVYCFSPGLPHTPTIDPFQLTQRKMLLDPTTGNYYLVDTPIQPATRRLYDPETGQYVDVPMPQQPMTPMPMPMPMSPLALSHGAYGHTYMIYPGLMPTPTMIPTRTLVQSQMSMQSEADVGEKASSQLAERLYMESPYYMATGMSPQTGPMAQQHVTTARAPQGFSGAKQPVISITSQQGPRIIAPPSFDGTTMSFVVEHR